MLAPGTHRLLTTGGGAALVEPGSLVQQGLTWIVAWAAALALLHLLLSLRRRSLPVALFCLLGALASVGTGLWALWDTILENSRRSLLAAVLWWPGFTLGLFVVGVLGAAGWAVVTLGLARLLGGRPQPAESEADG